MNKILFRKGLVLGIIILFFGAGVGSSNSNLVEKLNTNLLYMPHNPIEINGNDDFTSENGVTEGSGTYDNPFIIEGWEIDTNSQTGIHIFDTDVYFIIRNCYIHGDGLNFDGICFEQVKYGSIKECIITDNLNGIGFVWAQHSIIKNNTIKDNTFLGIGYAHCYFNNFNNTICQNDICNNLIGIWLLTSHYSKIFSNNFMSNIEQGVYLETCLCGGDNNKIYHNNFVYNGNEIGQVYCDNNWTNYWDDGYPSGGNYWSDYIGVDVYSGPNQTIPGSDGIGDTPYSFPLTTSDKYPLIEVWDNDFPPIANFNWVPYPPEPGESILFNASKSYDYDGIITLYEWDWDDDGVYDESNIIPTTTHTFVEAGYYQIILRVHNDNSENDTKTATIHVNTPPEALTITGITCGKPNITYNFTFNAIDPDGDNVRYIIDWGDDNMDTTGFNPSGADVLVSHSWTETGSYEGSVYPEDEYGAIGDETSFTITIKKTKSINTPFHWLQNFLQSHPNMFPILRQLLNL